MIKYEIMREAGAMLRSLFVSVEGLLKPGSNLMDIDNYVSQELRNYGARSALRMFGFNGYMSFALNNEVMQISAKNRELCAGDIVSIDMTLFHNGFFVDKAQTVVLEPKHYTKRYICHAVDKCYESALNSLRPGIKASSIGGIIETQAHILKMKIGKEFFGHGIGESHHMYPLIPNFDDGSTEVIGSDYYITIEPVIFYDHYELNFNGLEVLSNVLSAHREETIFINHSGFEVLT